MLSCQASYRIRHRGAFPLRKRPDGRAYLIGCRLKCCPACRYVKVLWGQLLPDWAKKVSSRNPRHCFITLNHRVIPIKENDAGDVWEQMARLEDRLRQWRTKLRQSFAVGGYIAWEVKHFQIARSPSARPTRLKGRGRSGQKVLLHVHVIAEPYETLREEERGTRLDHLKQLWRESAKEGDEIEVHITGVAEGKGTLNNRLRYVHGMRSGGSDGEFYPKTADGVWLPPLSEFVDEKDKVRRAALKAGSLQAEQLALILAAYSYQSRTSAPFGSWRKSPGTRKHVLHDFSRRGVRNNSP